MKRDLFIQRYALVCLALGLGMAAAHGAQRNNRQDRPLRPAGGAFDPSATPLVACDPYFSVWSFAGKLTDDTTRHWTGAEQGMAGLVRIDGKAFRVIGPDPEAVPALPQVALDVLPTRTLYRFEGAGIRLSLTFLTAALPEDLDLVSRPVTYLTWEAASTDGQPHEVQLYFDNTAESVVNVPSQSVVWSEETMENLSVLKFGSEDQPILAKRGDNLRIDWGYLYTAAPKADSTHAVIASAQACRGAFAESGNIPSRTDARQPRAANDQTPVAAFAFDLGRVTAQPVGRWLMLAYDDLYAIQYFRQNLRPYWRRNGADAVQLLKTGAREYAALRGRCAAFDEEVMADMKRIGGPLFAKIGALAYRQCLAANKIAADANGQPLMFPKENFSNGCIATVDVIYPMAPQFLLFSPSLTKAMLVPILDYAKSDRWHFPFAPHDLGTYPQANGQVYGGGERTEENQMPVEESGNMLILLAALAKMEGNADFVDPYWGVIQRWAEYLETKGFDPENQLCTDDFAGHLAHNVNLSAKAICALGSVAQLCDLRGESAQADHYRQVARKDAGKWIQEADDGNHYRLAFDKPGTWSQKYNLVWDRILGLGLFPDRVRETEMKFYQRVQNRFGLPLDNRRAYTKLDWTIWSATLTADKSDFETLVKPVYDFLDQTPDRVPMTDWYWTDSGRHRGFQARSVVGGVFIPLLYDGPLWKKWAGRDHNQPKNWAPLPPPVKTVALLPAAEEQAVTWHYTTRQPAKNWPQAAFDAGDWKEGPAGFGTRGTPGAAVRTVWNTPDIWIRRAFELPDVPAGQLGLWLHHDEDAQVYINGVLAASLSGYSTGYDWTPISAAARATLKAGP